MSMTTGAVCNERQDAILRERYGQRMTYDQLHAELERQKDSKVDIVAKASDIEVLPVAHEDFGETAVLSDLVLPRIMPRTYGPNLNGSSIGMLFDDGIMNELNGPIPINDHMMGQFATWSGIHRDTVRKFESEDPELLACMMSRELLKHGDDVRTTRTLDRGGRAWLSGIYGVYDNPLIVESVMPHFEADSRWQVQECSFTETRMRIRMVMPMMQREIRVGDPVCLGALIENSEVGAGALRVQLEILRLMCTNTQTFPDHGLVKVHKGGRMECGIRYAQDTIDADSRLLSLKMRDTIQQITSTSTFEGIIENMREMAETEVNDPSSAVQLVAQDLSLTKEETLAVQNSLVRGGDGTVWGVVNAVTDVARDMADYDRKAGIERTIGGITEKGNWGRIVNATPSSIKKRRRLN